MLLALTARLLPMQPKVVERLYEVRRNGVFYGRHFDYSAALECARNAVSKHPSWKMTVVEMVEVDEENVN